MHLCELWLVALKVTVNLWFVKGVSARQPALTGIQGALQEFCQLETFEPQCWKNEVIVMETAIYGRRHVGKCLKPEEAAISRDPRFFGCHANVLQSLHGKCSGRHQCSVRIPDPDLEGTEPCLTGLKMFLEVSYSCVDVVEEDRSCSVPLTSSPLHITSSSSRQSNINCGTKTQPWLLEAPAGQRINISLLDFTDSQHLTRSSSSSSSGSCVHQYGYIIDKSNNVRVSVCAGQSSGLQHVYFSTSSQLKLITPEFNNVDANLMLRVEAVGCTDLIPPEDSWLKRDGDKIVIGCYTSRQTWQLRCVDGRWRGVLSNCTTVIVTGLGADDSNNVPVEGHGLSSRLNEYQVTAIVAVGFAGFAICLTIICCGIVCLRRFYALNGNETEKNSTIKYSYMQPGDDVNRRSTGQQCVMSSVNTSHNKTTSLQPRYPVNADGTNDVTVGHVATVNGQYFVLDPEAVANESGMRE